MAYQAINPYNGERIQTFETATDADIETILKQAHDYYLKAKRVSPKTRAEQLHRLAQEFLKHETAYAKYLTTNMGKLIGEAKGEVKKTADFADYYAQKGPDHLKPITYSDVPGHHAYVEFDSIGAVLAVEPWNFPYTQIMRVFAPNFIIGNPVILKHARIVPQAAQAFEKAVKAVGIPEGAFKNVFASYEQVSHLLADPRLQGVALTGSAGAGDKIAAQAGKYLKKSTMELGGTDVFIVLDDADIAQAAKDAAAARLRNCGQVCTAAKRFIVQDAVYDDFLAALKTEFAHYQFGDPMAPKTTLAPLSSKEAQQNLHQQVQEALATGAQILYGDPALPQGPGAFFNPLILAGLTPDNAQYGQEFFGPVAQIYQASDEAAILKIANEANYGLGGAVYSADLSRAKKVASQIETGQVAINEPLTSYPQVPFGGVKDSGYGRELSDFGIREFVNAKTVLYAK